MKPCLYIYNNSREEEEQIVTPFAQILATLKDVRSSLATMVSKQGATDTTIANNTFLDKFRSSKENYSLHFGIKKNVNMV